MIAMVDSSPKNLVREIGGGVGAGRDRELRGSQLEALKSSFSSSGVRGNGEHLNELVSLALN